MSKRCLIAIVSLLGLVGCGGVDEPDTGSDQPWTIHDNTPSSDGLRVLIIHDMEGLSGQDDPTSFNFGSELYSQGQEWLAADVNAVIDGLFAGGATEVLVADGHGSGNPEPDIRSDLLDPRAEQIIRNAWFDTYFDLPESELIDAVAVVGMHAKTGSGGFASHTFTLGIELRIRGQPITETELVALSWGRVGVPVIFASGDDRLAADLVTMPWIEYVTVKEATAADSAQLRPAEQAREDLRAGARRAVERIGEAKVMRAATPVHASLRAVPPASLEVLAGIPGIDYENGVLSFVAEDMRSAYDGFVATVGLATTAYSEVLLELVLARPDGSEVVDAYWAELSRRWFDQESGRLRPSGPETNGTPSGEQYHGYR